MLWKFFHNLLPTQSRLHRITRTTPTPVCKNCDTGAEDHAWYHTFLSCPATKTIMDWLVETLQRIPIQDASIEMAIWLQFTPPIPENDLLCAVWLVGETLTYSWARRRNREALSIPSLTTSLLMRDRRPYELKYFVRGYNLFQTCLSFWGFTERWK